MKTLRVFIPTCAVLAIAFSCKTIQKVSTTPKEQEQSVASTVKDAKQEVIKITEIDAKGKIINLELADKVIDPNSSLKITIDQKALLSVVRNNIHSNIDLTNKLSLLTKMLNAEVKAMINLKAAIAGYKKNTEWKKALGSLDEFTSLVFDDPEASAIYESLPPTNDIIQQYSNMFITAKTYANQLEELLKAEAKKNGVYLQMGGWINNDGGSRPVHIPGFDDIATSNFRVEQFQLVLTDEQKKELDTYDIAAKKANIEGLAAAMDTRKVIETLILKIIGTESISEIVYLQKKIRTYLDSANIDLASAKTSIQTGFDQIQTYRDYINSIITKYRQQGTSNGSDLLAQLNTDISNIEQQTINLSANLAVDAANIDSNLNALNMATKAVIKDLPAQLKVISTNVIRDIRDFKKEIISSIQMIMIGENLNAASLQFSQEVKKISLDQIQTETTLDLETTGKREIGDTFVIKLRVGMPDGHNFDFPELRYYLYFCTPYVQTTVSFLFADQVPVFRKVNDKALFQYAPSYSILLKGIWKRSTKARRSVSYHTVLSPGLGINVSTLDFNGDGAPEVGVGFAFSIFRDFLQLGYGVNTFEGSGFSFFGFKLPIGALSLR